VEDLGRRQALLRVGLEAGTEEDKDARGIGRKRLLSVGARDRKGGRGGVVAVQDSHGLDSPCPVLEWGTPPAESVKEDTQCPNIYGGADGFLGVEVDLLGRAVGESGVFVDVFFSVADLGAIAECTMIATA